MPRYYLLPKLLTHAYKPAKINMLMNLQVVHYKTQEKLQTTFKTDINI